MNQSTHSDRTPHTVSTVTKHIKIYSDNPIHDCIDRIIDEISLLDNAQTSHILALLRIQDAADELSNVCKYARSQIMIKQQIKYHAKRPN
jgi:hypothetical protein